MKSFHCNLNKSTCIICHMNILPWQLYRGLSCELSSPRANEQFLSAFGRGKGRQWLGASYTLNWNQAYIKRFTLYCCIVLSEMYLILQMYMMMVNQDNLMTGSPEWTLPDSSDKTKYHLMTMTASRKCHRNMQWKKSMSSVVFNIWHY